MNIRIIWSNLLKNIISLANYLQLKLSFNLLFTFRIINSTNMLKILEIISCKKTLINSTIIGKMGNNSCKT